MKKNNYLEIQRFNIFLYFVVIIVLLVLFIGIYRQLILKIPFGSKPMDSTGLIIFTSAYAIFVFIFILSSLKTSINSEGITIAFFPFFKNKIYKWNEIKTIDVINYNPLRDYWGWGIRHNYNKNTFAYTTKGNCGINITLYSGAKILIGTQKPTEVNKEINLYISKF